ncbi:hypothetical protein EAI_16849 [Harpegnathos saltator]|uniref:Uncharacterized protein n=1 Tax=Harpegnathos saltator TaxID=610380 RepID=E2BSC4_HARSA|nr:hypothetical protein EAI_16849 [Harpegnathos saltator]
MKLENITIEEAVEIAGGNKKLYEEKFDKFRQWLKQQVHLPQGYLRTLGHGFRNLCEVGPTFSKFEKNEQSSDCPPKSPRVPLIRVV